MMFECKGPGKTRKAYFWACRSNDLAPGPPILVFDYQPGRHGVHARNFLEGWRGHLVVDDYAGYKALFAHGVTELACLAHARRKFFDLYAANQSLIAAEALRRIGELYEVEHQAQGMDAAGRLQLRQQEARPRLEALRTWLIDTRIGVADGGGTAKALDYSIKRWPALIRYAESGVLPIDNNPVENSIRPIAIGKKNSLNSVWTSVLNCRQSNVPNSTQTNCFASIPLPVSTVTQKRLARDGWHRTKHANGKAWPPLKVANLP